MTITITRSNGRQHSYTGAISASANGSGGRSVLMNGPRGGMYMLNESPKYGLWVLTTINGYHGSRSETFDADQIAFEDQS